MLGHADLPGVQLVGIFWTPPADERTAAVLGYRYPVPQPTHHYYAEIGGAVAYESAQPMWLDLRSYLARNRAIVYVRHTPEEVAAMLGADTWEASTPAQRELLDVRLRWELVPNAEGYLKRTGQLGAYALDWYKHYTELTWYRRRLGL